MLKKPAVIFTALILVFLATRFAVLWYSPATFAGPEETVNGVLPLHMDRGFFMEPYYYQYEECSGGTFITGLLAYMPFKLFGPTYFALKLVPFFFSTVLFIVLLWIAYRYFGFGVAVFTGILALFPPTFFIERSLVAYGNHMEGAVFTFIALGLFLWFRQRKPDTDIRRTATVSILFGLLSGFAVYFDYQFLIMMAVLAPFAIASWRLNKSTLVQTTCFIAGGLIGFYPWRLYHKGEIFIPYIINYYTGRYPAQPDVGFLEKFHQYYRTLSVNLDSWFRYYDLNAGGTTLADGSLFNALMLIVFFGLFGFIIFNCKKELAGIIKATYSGKDEINWEPCHNIAPALFYVPVHFLAFVFFASNYPTGIPLPQRYLHPLFPFLFLIAGYALCRLWDGGLKALAGIILGLSIIIGIAGNAGLFKGGQPGITQKAPGYSYQYFYGEMQKVFDIDIDDGSYIVLSQDKFPDNHQEFYEGLCVGVALLNEVDASKHLAAASEYKGKSKNAFAAGMGAATKVAKGIPAGRRIESGLMPFFKLGQSMGEEIRTQD